MELWSYLSAYAKYKKGFVIYFTKKNRDQAIQSLMNALLLQ